MQHTYNHSGQMSTLLALTYDELLTEHVGQFGPGQLLSLFWASLHEIANAAALFMGISHCGCCGQPQLAMHGPFRCCLHGSLETGQPR